MSCGVGCRHGSDLALLWLWCRPAAIAPIRPLAWEALYAAGVALKRQRTKKKKKMQYGWSDVFSPITGDVWKSLNLKEHQVLYN